MKLIPVLYFNLKSSFTIIVSDNYMYAWLTTYLCTPYIYNVDSTHEAAGCNACTCYTQVPTNYKAGSEKPVDVGVPCILLPWLIYLTSLRS